MFFRVKPAGDRRYLQIVENRRDGAKTRQTVVATLGRLDELEASGKLDVLLASGARLCETAMLVSSLRQGTLDAVSTRRIGAPLVFGRLWEQTGCRAVIEALIGRRGFEFPVERAIFATRAASADGVGLRPRLRALAGGLPDRGRRRDGVAPSLPGDDLAG